MHRPYKVSSPIIPGIALVLGIFCAIAFAVANTGTVIKVIILFIAAAVYYVSYGKNHLLSEEEEFHAVELLDASGRKYL